MTLTELAKQIADGKPVPDNAHTIIDFTADKQARMIQSAGIPDFLDVRKNGTLDMRGFNDAEGVAMAKSNAERIPLPPASQGRIAKAAASEDERAKTAARIGRMKAKRAGLKALGGMPLEGKAALAAIAEATAKIEAADKKSRTEKWREHKAAVKAAKSRRESQQKERTEMARAAKKKTKEAAKAKTAVSKAKRAKRTSGQIRAASKPSRTVSRAPRSGSKTEAIRALLIRKSGCTRAEALEASGWPSISMQAFAEQAGLSLRSEQEEGRTLRYYGIESGNGKATKARKKAKPERSVDQSPPADPCELEHSPEPTADDPQHPAVPEVPEAPDTPVIDAPAAS